MPITDQQYHEDFTEWGRYQFVTLQEFINDMLATLQDDEFVSSTNRRTILHHSKRQLQELTYDAAKEIRAIELEVNPNTLFVTVPQDFVNYVRISWVSPDGRLYPMAENNNLSVATAYLQDNNYELLYDMNGYILKGSGQRPRHIDDFVGEDEDGARSHPYYYYYSFAPNTDTSQVYPRGAYKLDRKNGVIEFTEAVGSRNIVLEYISDGLFFSEGEDVINAEDRIRFHKFGRDAMYYGVLTRLTEGRRNVPLSRVQDLRRQYQAAVRRFKRRVNTLRKDELLQYMRHSNQWIKGVNQTF